MPRPDAATARRSEGHHEHRTARVGLRVHRGLLATVTPEQLDLPTPCASWKVRDLINHLIGVSNWSAEAMEAGEATMRIETDSSGGNFVAAYDDSIPPRSAPSARPGRSTGP